MFDTFHPEKSLCHQVSRFHCPKKISVVADKRLRYSMLGSVAGVVLAREYVADQLRIELGEGNANSLTLDQYGQITCLDVWNST